MVEANITRAAAAVLAQGAAAAGDDTSRASLTVRTDRSVDEDGFFVLTDEEIEQIINCCEP